MHWVWTRLHSGEGGKRKFSPRSTSYRLSGRLPHSRSNGMGTATSCPEGEEIER